MEHALTWFEIPVSEIGRAKRFYQEIFKIEMQDMVVNDHPLALFPFSGVSGALWQEEGYSAPQSGTRIYLTARENIDVILARVEAAGGKTIFPRTPVSDEIGWSAMFQDLDGNRIGLLEEPHE